MTERHNTTDYDPITNEKPLIRRYEGSEMPYCLSIVDCRRSHQRAQGHLATKILASSLLRNLPIADLHIVRVAPKQPLFRVGREGVHEEWMDESAVDLSNVVPQWLPSAFIDGSKYSWVFFIGDGSIALRDLDHLLKSEADILWAPLSGVSLRSTSCGGYVTEVEMQADRSEHPCTRPWMEGASSAVWAVRGQHYGSIMAEWNRIAGNEPLRACSNRIESAWNRVLMDTELVVTRFERGEIAFPALSGVTYEDWHESALLNVGQLDSEIRNKFLQSQFFGTYLGDQSGLFFTLLDQ